MWLQLNCFVVVISIVIATGVQQPNIVFIVADDLGWDDVSFHGSDQILTPNIDTLAYQGVVLNQYYSDSEGTASRSAMFTGKYPMRLGMQGGSLKASEDRGIPVSERLLPNFLHELGYKTHLVGKWGIGKSRAHYLPTHRGFDTFYGFTGDSVDYLTYNAEEDVNGQSFFGLDLFENLEAVEDQSGHLTEILTDRAVQVIRNHNTTTPLYLHLSHAAPHVGGGLVNLQPPADSVKANNHIAHSARRLYAGLVSSLDNSVGYIVAALAERNILHNTVIAFVSDNGAPTLGPSQNFGSNFPFRGVKGTPWEGGVRSIGIVWHSTIVPRVSDSIFHVTDWLPTLVTAAGGYVEGKVDGVNQWFTLIDGETPQRTEALITVDDLEGWAAYRYSDFKLILGDVNGKVSGHYGNKFKQSKFKNQSEPFYDNLLLDSETARVFGEILQLYVDVDAAFSKRANFNLTQINRGSNVTTDICVPTKAKGCLFNVTADPMETIDLWNTSPDIVRRMSLQLRSLWTELKARHRPQSDPRANPSLRNYVWLPWVNNEEMILDPPPVPPFPMQVSMRELQYLVDMNFNLLKEKLNVYIGSAKEAITKSVGVLFY